MKARVRTLVSVAVLAALAALCALIHAGTARERALRTCEGIRVEYADDYRFVSEQDIKDYLDKYYGAYIGQRLDSIRLHKVEDILDVQSAILKSEAYTTEDGMLNIRLTQREPVIRFQKGSYGFYADCNGFIFPLQENYTSPVPVMDGAVPVNCPEGFKGAPETEAEREWMAGVVALVGYMDKSRIWSENIVQMHVEANGDIVMIPRQGNERFIFGSPFGAKDKFDRMSDYYRYILPEKGEGYYRTVNVKFDKQIVCKK
jgi:cell division protein FtsQ